MSDADQADVLVLTAFIVTAHIRHNQVPSDALPGLIQSVYLSLSSAGADPIKPEQAAALTPAVPVKKSVFPDYIACLEDGKRLKMLKRHLQTSYAMTPSDYRAKWGLPADYPMVAPSYASKRSELAKSIGLGRKAEVAHRSHDEPNATAQPEVTIVPARRAKGSKG